MPNITEKLTHHSQLNQGGIYIAKGRVCRFTGTVKRVGLLMRKRPIFRAHKERFSAKITEVTKADDDAIRAYLGRRADEPLRGTNERVQHALSLPILAEFEKATARIKTKA